MKIHDLFEAVDWKDIKNPAKRWLAKYTYENTDKNPNDYIISELIKKYPAESGTIYRGINFYTKKLYDDFIQKFNGKKSAILKFDTISSWTRNENDSEQFAVTQPTYNMNYIVMSMYQKQQERKERLSGYRGIIISTNIQDGVSIDVDKSDLGHESEIILPKGSYTVSIHKIIKKYEEELSDKNTTVDKVIQNTKSLEDAYKENSFFKYVMHHHLDSINSKSRDHLFYLFKPNQYEPPLVQHSIYGNDKYGIEVNFNIPSHHLFDLYNTGVFKSAEQKRIIKQLAQQILDEAMPLVLKYIGVSKNINSRFFLDLAKIVNPQEVRKIYCLMTDKIRNEYNKLNGPEETDRLNSITDERERRLEMKKHIEKLQNLMQKIRNLGS